MTRGQSQFVGSAGEYHIAYCLSVRGIHAAITSGNAPDIDILASNGDGSKHLAIQVKTSQNAYKKKRYGYELCEWYVNSGVVGRGSSNLWFAFVDLNASEDRWEPTVYIVPSLWVGKFVQPEWPMKMYMLRSLLWEQTKERWDKIGLFLADDKKTLDWCSSVPDDALGWKWPP